MKKIFSLFLFILIVISAFSSSLSVIGANETSQLEKIISFAKSKIGSTEYAGRCQAFVYWCYKAGGIDNGSASSAIAAWEKWGVSTSRDIPVGACVYFNENVGSEYGHVGLYIGNNTMIHSRASVGKVVESTLTWFFNNNCYLGWGWQGGVQPTGSVVPSTITDYYKLTAPDGVQTVRENYSTSSNAVIDIPTGNIVCVTKYSPDGKWGYVTYNGKSGWIKLYYVEQVDSPASSVNKDYYKLTAPDGVQTMRTSYSTSSAAILDIPAGNIVCVTKYSPNGEWGYVTYNGQSGWIKLYYVEPHTVHTYGAWKTTKTATCTAAGMQKRTCSCGVFETQSTSALGHNYSLTFTVDTPATCTTVGVKSKHCTRCAEKNEVTAIPATGHAYGSWQIVATAGCTSTGSQKRVCSTCSHTEYKTISALGHNYSTSWTADKVATCTTSGSKSHHCTRCTAKSDITTIAATGHTWSDWTVTKQATYEATGTKVRQCTTIGCSAQETTVIAQLSLDGHTHDFDEWVTQTAATCDQGGMQKHTCSICKSVETRELTALGHVFGDWMVEKVAECTENGMQKRICSNCREIETLSLPALGHSFEDWIEKNAATQDREGLWERKCCNCSTVETQNTPKLADSDSDSNIDFSAEPTTSPNLIHNQQANNEENGNVNLTTVIIVCTVIIVATLGTMIFLIVLKKKS